jgi:hypothetical protein
MPGAFAAVPLLVVPALALPGGTWALCKVWGCQRRYLPMGGC